MHLLPRPRSLFFVILGGLALVGCKNDEKSSDAAAGPEEQKSQQLAPVATAAPAEKVLTEQQKRACLGAPLSPSANELPEVGGLIHVVQGDHTHLFVFQSPSNNGLDMYGPNLLARRLQTALGTKEKFGFGGCGNDPKYKSESCAILRVEICEPWVPTVKRWAPAAQAEGLGVMVKISDSSAKP